MHSCRGYDKVKYCVHWIQTIISREHAEVKVNDDVGPFFSTHKGL
jgi:hypothetical protein